ncbi:MAG: TraB/GumN family protein, partial [Pseudomonadota bacterium]
MDHRGANISGHRIWRRLGTLALAALAPIALSGCFQEPEPDPDTSPPLYEITNSQGAVEGWMLGTIHALPDGVAWRTKAIDRVIDDADLLVVEIADLHDRQAIADIYAELAISPDLPPLPQRLPPSQRPALSSMIERAGLKPAQLTTTETWAAALALAQVDAQGDPKNGVDRIVIEEFDGRDVIEFEGAVAQLTIFDSLPEDDQRDLLSGVVEEWQLVKEDPGRLRDAWLKGDTATLEQVTTAGIMADVELRDALLVKRNRAWTG